MRNKSAILALAGLLALVVGITSAGPPGEPVQASDCMKEQYISVVSAAAHVALAIIVSHDLGAPMDGPAAPAIVAKFDERMGTGNSREAVGILPHRASSDRSRSSLYGHIAKGKAVLKIGHAAGSMNYHIRA